MGYDELEMKHPAFEEWSDEAMSQLTTLENRLIDEGANAARSGNFQRNRKCMGLAEQLFAVRAELKSLGLLEVTQAETSPTTTANRNSFPKFWVERDVLRKMG